MKKIILLLLLCAYCSKIDDPFFNLNPNRAAVYKEARDKCRRDGYLFYLLSSSLPAEQANKECDDPTSPERKKNPDPKECRKKAKADFELGMLALISSCPKGLLDE